MKLIKTILGGLFILGGFVVLSGLLHAQESATDNVSALSDFETELMVLETTTPMPASQLPEDTHGFYSAQNPDWPPLPGDVLELPIWPLGDGLYVLDDTNVDYVALAQSQPAAFSRMAGGFSPDLSFSTNSLWLQMLSVTNGTARLVIYPPSNVTDGVYDLLYCTNLDSPIAWQWLLRSNPGQTNLVVPNATNKQGFYRLGPPNDLIANDSLGTNFWIAFFNLPDEGLDIDDDNYISAVLSLYITSPVGATGTVTAPGVMVNGPVLIVSNCGDANLNGTYILTNLSAAEQTAWSDYIPGTPSNPSYVNGTNQVIDLIDGVNSFYTMVGYDSSNTNSDPFTPLYYKGDNILSGTNWESGSGSGFVDTNLPVPTTSCAQVSFSQSFSVTPGAVTNIIIPVAAIITNYDAVGTNGINVVATQPVSVYAFDYCPALSTAFTGYPTTLLGTNYCVMARAPEDEDALDAGYANSQLAIVATADNTTVTITPSPTADFAGHTNAYTETLQQGETYQINGSNYTNDVTGTLITSDEPIGVFAGAGLAWVPDTNTAAGNPLLQEQLPVDSWGTQALALSFAGRTNGDSYRVLAAYNDTVVIITGNVVTITNETINPYGPWLVTDNNEVVVTNLAAGVPYDIIVDGPVEFQGSQPIQVAQFANGVYFDNPPNSYGDPCEILLLATDRYLETNTVFTSTNDFISGDFDENYLNIIVAQSATNSTSVDGSIVAATNFVAIGTSGYYGAQIVVTNSGVHTVTSSQPVGVEVYGFGPYDAYGYFGSVVK